MWGNISCIRKQHDGRNWATNYQTFRSEVPTTPPRPPLHVGASITTDKVVTETVVLHAGLPLIRKKNSLTVH